MKHIMITLLAGLLALPVHAKEKSYRLQMDLSGSWQLTLDAAALTDARQPREAMVTLPGTTDTNRQGNPCTDRSQTGHLSRLFSYVGKAWYRRTVVIPREWGGKRICLHMERTKPSTVFVDGRSQGSQGNICTPQVYDLTAALTPGSHEICILVDNSSGVPRQVYASSHAFTEDTQTNWNGIIGRFFLEAVNPVHFTRMTVKPDAAARKAQVLLRFEGTPGAKARLRVAVTDLAGRVVTSREFRKITLEPTSKPEHFFPLELSLGADSKLWSEFSPQRYVVKAEITGEDTLSATFGLVDFRAHDRHFYVNGNLTFLRGKHDACVFPQTAHAPMDVETWRRYLATCRRYGINHVRFHSWCPPDAAFTAADEMGVYLQPELPFWGDFNAADSTLMNFLLREGKQLLMAYGNHPSFVMMALGNELWGSVETMQQLVRVLRAFDSRKLYTLGSSYYLGFRGVSPEMDYFTTCRTAGEAWGQFHTHTRGSFGFCDALDGGIINHFRPSTSWNFEQACLRSSVPVISHETGQFQTYPDFDSEIPQYQGVLRPYNMEEFRRRLQAAGMGDQAADFHRASGAWSVSLYKADIEADLRTRHMAGFHLLDIQDYPGQGSAYVGILDANMQSKGLVTPEEWRQWCSPVVVLMEADSCVLATGQQAGQAGGSGWKAGFSIANYSGRPLQGKTLTWRLVLPGGQTAAEGSLPVPADSVGLFSVGTAAADLRGIRQPTRLTVEVAVGGTPYHNSYPLWVYPEAENKITDLEKGILIASHLTDEMGKKLENGASVLWLTSPTSVREDSVLNASLPVVQGLFQTDYWNYRMFKTICENNKKPVSPGTLGIFTHPEHPLFRGFPTEEHTNWQWFSIIKGSSPMILDAFPRSYRPIVQVIDNIERNHKLGLVFEFKVGRGRLLVCMSNLRRQLQYPESRAFYRSMLQYMHSADFRPSFSISFSELKATLSRQAASAEIGELRNISYD